MLFVGQMIILQQNYIENFTLNGFLAVSNMMKIIVDTCMAANIN